MELIFGIVTGNKLHELLLEMCLALLIFHCEYIKAYKDNHCIHKGCILFTTSGMVDAAVGNIKASHPWKDDGRDFHFTGIPPHVSLLFELKGVAEYQKTVADDVVVRMMDVLDERQIGGGNMTEGQKRQMMGEVLDSHGELGSGKEGGPIQEVQQQSPRGNTMVFLHIYGGRLHKIPER